MKRKLGRNDSSVEMLGPEPTPADSKFEDLRLDARLLRAITKEGFAKPTPVQAEAIPLALAGKDILARAKTGSGKTAAYVLPVLQALLRRKAQNPHEKASTSLVLVPTRELAEQVYKVFVSFSAFCAREVRSVNIAQRVSDDVLRSMLAEAPEIVISTPGRASQNINSGFLSLKNLCHLVIDEADLVLSYGYGGDLDLIAKQVPRGLQTCLMSATFTPEVDTVKRLFCRDPVVLKLDDKEEEGNGLSQYTVRCAEDEKFLLIYVIFKLQLVKGKCIVFVTDVDRSYRLKLFLEQFGIKSCVLNSELPVNSRIHVVQEFNKGIYDTIIAADDQEVLGAVASRKKASAGETDMQTEAEPYDNFEEDDEAEPAVRKRKLTGKSKDYGVSRGIDFQDVASVINFDLPSSAKAYTHRVGRTARAGRSGIALSFVIPAEHYKKHPRTSVSSARHDEKVLARIVSRQVKRGKEIQPYQFDMKQVDPFRYRMNDALAAVSRNAVRLARARELKQELLKSEKLKRHFEENPEDVRHLRHDGEIRAIRTQPHLKHVPEYLMPIKGRKALAADDLGFVGLRKIRDNKVRKARVNNHKKGRRGRPSARTLNPLKSFSAKGRR